MIEDYVIKVIWLGDFYLGPWQVPAELDLAAMYINWVTSEMRCNEDPVADPVRFAHYLTTKGARHVWRDVEWWAENQPMHDRPLEKELRLQHDHPQQTP